MIRRLLAPREAPPRTAEPPASMLFLQLKSLCDALDRGDRARATYFAEAAFPPEHWNPASVAGLAQAGRFEIALQMMERIATSGLMEPHASRAWQNLGYCQLLAGHATRAVAAFDEAVRLSPALEPPDPAYHHLYHQGLAVTQSWDAPGRRKRFHRLLGFVREATGLEGDCAECGCWRGLSSFLICTTLKDADPAFDGRGYHIFDSFQGLSEPGPEDSGVSHQAGHFTASVHAVQRNLSGFPQIAFHPGWIPKSFEGLAERRYRFVHVDVDLYEPTDGAIRYFVPRLVPGGILVCDDFNWPGARKAIEQYCAQGAVSFETTDTHQAVIRAA